MVAELCDITYDAVYNWSNPSLSHLYSSSLGVPAFTEACGHSACIPQPSTSQTLDSLSDRLMYRLAFRNRNGTQSLLLNHSVNVGSQGGLPVGIHWYELRATPYNGRPPSPGPYGLAVYQAGTFNQSGSYAWMGSIAMDKVGDIALGYSFSSSSVFPSVGYTGRTPTDSLGTMETPKTIISGTGYQTTSSRWGDYSSMSVDPTDDCTFWYTQQYIKTTGQLWNTRIASFKFPSCN